MRHRHISDIVISATLMLMLFSGPAAAQNVGEVPDIQSPGHNSEIPSRVSRIDVTWGIPEGDPYGYFVLFNTNPGHTFGGLNPDGEHVTRRSFTSPDFAAFQPDDVAYYFHIAAADGKGDIGLTVTAGPYRIDVVPPSDVGVTAPEVTSVRTVTLTLRAEGASEVHISNVAHGEGGRWENLTGETEWELSPGGREKTVHVRFSDLAGNTAGTSVIITFIAGDADGDLSLSLRDAVPVLQVLAGMETADISPDADVNGNGRIGTEEAVYILKEISGTDSE